METDERYGTTLFAMVLDWLLVWMAEDIWAAGSELATVSKVMVLLRLVRPRWIAAVTPYDTRPGAGTPKDPGVPVLKMLLPVTVLFSHSCS